MEGSWSTAVCDRTSQRRTAASLLESGTQYGRQTVPLGRTEPEEIWGRACFLEWLVDPAGASVAAKVTPSTQRALVASLEALPPIVLLYLRVQLYLLRRNHIISCT
jgi:hypothetical protein